MNATYCFIFLLYSFLIPTIYPSLIQVIQNDNCIGGAASYNCTLTGPINTAQANVNFNISNITFTLVQVQSSATINGIDMRHFYATATNMGLDIVLSSYSHIEMMVNITNIIAEYRNIAIGCILVSDPSNFANTQFTLPSPPATPPSINATALGVVCGARPNWTAPYSESPITGYILYQNGIEISNDTAISYSIHQLTSGETYNYTVLATTCVGTSPVSKDELFTTPKDAGISATNCAATYDAVSRVFTLVFTQPLQDYPISYIINISSTNSTQLFTTVLTIPPFTINVTLDTTYNYTSSITAVLNCPSASNVTCSADVTIIPIPTTAAAADTTTTPTITSPTTSTPITPIIIRTPHATSTNSNNNNIASSLSIASIVNSSVSTCPTLRPCISNATTDSSPLYILFPLTIVLLIVWMLLMVIVCTFITCFLLTCYPKLDLIKDNL